MQTGKKFLKTALAITLGVTIISPNTLLAMAAEDAPETITIDSMANLYTSVEFNHEMHTEYASCQECHHHTTGAIVAAPNCARCHHNHDENDIVSCSGCHVANRFSEKYLVTLEKPELFHIDKPGLLGAYHLNCISCHEVTSGPTGCQECHTMTEAGEKRFDTGPFSPKAGKNVSEKH